MKIPDNYSKNGLHEDGQSASQIEDKRINPFKEF